MTQLPLTKEHVRAKLAALLLEVARIPANQIHDYSTLDADLHLESVTFIELQVAIEDEYEIQLDPIHLVELNELGAIVDYVYDCAIAAAQ